MAARGREHVAGTGVVDGADLEGGRLEVLVPAPDRGRAVAARDRDDSAVAPTVGEHRGARRLLLVHHDRADAELLEPRPPVEVDDAVLSPAADEPLWGEADEAVLVAPLRSDLGRDRAEVHDPRLDVDDRDVRSALQHAQHAPGARSREAERRQRGRRVDEDVELVGEHAHAVGELVGVARGDHRRLQPRAGVQQATVEGGPAERFTAVVEAVDRHVSDHQRGSPDRRCVGEHTDGHEGGLQ